MGNKAAKPDNRPEGPVRKISHMGKPVSALPSGESFYCKVKDTLEDRILTVSFPNLYLFSADRVLISTFPIKYLRGYGQMHDIFSFETGRKSPGGAHTYFFQIETGKDVFIALNDCVAQHNDGVAGNRYDHLPAFANKGKGSSRPLPPAVGQDTYSSLDREQPALPPSRGPPVSARTAGYGSSDGGLAGYGSSGPYPVEQNYESAEQQPSYDTFGGSTTAAARRPAPGESTYNALSRGGGSSTSYNSLEGARSSGPALQPAYDTFGARGGSQTSYDSLGARGAQPAYDSLGGRSPVAAASSSTYNVLGSHPGSPAGETAYNVLGSHPASPASDPAYNVLGARGPEGAYNTLGARGSGHGTPPQPSYDSFGPRSASLQPAYDSLSAGRPPADGAYSSLARQDETAYGFGDAYQAVGQPRYAASSSNF